MKRLPSHTLGAICGLCIVVVQTIIKVYHAIQITPPPVYRNIWYEVYGVMAVLVLTTIPLIVFLWIKKFKVRYMNWFCWIYPILLLYANIHAQVISDDPLNTGFVYMLVILWGVISAIVAIRFRA